MYEISIFVSIFNAKFIRISGLRVFLFFCFAGCAEVASRSTLEPPELSPELREKYFPAMSGCAEVAVRYTLDTPVLSPQLRQKYFPE